jgi:hypothetical protein
MASVIKIKRSTSPGSAPSSLAAGEIAVNIPDRLLFVGDGSSIYSIGAQYLAVANASAIYATKAYAAANAYVNILLANTNSSIATQATRITLVNTNLTGTNTALRTLISDRLQVANAAAIYQTIATERAALANTNASIADRLQVANAAAIYQTIATERAALANTNSSIATQASRITLVNTNLTGTNTALRTLISDRLQVSNAAAIYQTIATERAALANTNASIATQASRVTLVNTNLTGTNTALRTLISDRLQVANAATLYTTKIDPTTSGLFAHTGRMTISTNLAVSGNTRISGSTIIDGDLTVEGGVTYISSSTLNVDDSMIKLAANNAADTIDIGFYGKYDSSGVKYSGLFRDASDGIFKFYKDSQTEPGTTVNTAAAGHAAATIEAIIDGGTY